MTHASVFSGIGGPEVAATMLGWENLFHCEINPFGRKVLDYWYPNAKSYEDITKTDFREWRGRVNVLTGGFPCQPFSYAGQRRGAEDDRYLWPHMYRCIDEIRPDWVVAENVAGILTMVEQGTVSKVASSPTLFDTGDMVRGQFRLTETFTLERICTDLESHGYAVQPILIPACAVGAPHRRDRVFIVAHAIGSGEGTPRKSGEPESSRGDTHQQQSERRTATEWDNRLYEFLQPIADTRSGGQPTPQQQSERARQTIQQQGGKQPFDGIVRPCTPRTTTDTDSHRGCEMDEHLEPKQPNGAEPFGNGRERNAADTQEQHSERMRPKQPEIGRPPQIELGGRSGKGCDNDIAGCGRWSRFPTVSPVHRGNDGIPFDVDCLTISFGKWRTEALKAYGNAIVPQVMYEIFRAIEIAHNK